MGTILTEKPAVIQRLVTQAWNDLAVAVTAAQGEVCLASPFMGAGVLSQMAHSAQTKAATWRVITRLDAAAVAHGSLSTQGLRQLIDAGVEVRSLPNLHAK